MGDGGPCPVVEGKRQKAQEAMELEPSQVIHPEEPVTELSEDGWSKSQTDILKDDKVDCMVDLHSMPEHVNAQSIDKQTQQVKEEEENLQPKVVWVVGDRFTCTIASVDQVRGGDVASKQLHIFHVEWRGDAGVGQRHAVQLIVDHTLRRPHWSRHHSSLAEMEKLADADENLFSALCTCWGMVAMIQLRLAS